MVREKGPDQLRVEPLRHEGVQLFKLVASQARAFPRSRQLIEPRHGVGEDSELKHDHAGVVASCDVSDSNEFAVETSESRHGCDDRITLRLAKLRSRWIGHLYLRGPRSVQNSVTRYCLLEFIRSCYV